MGLFQWNNAFEVETGLDEPTGLWNPKMIDKLEQNPNGNNDLGAEAEVVNVGLKLNCLDLEPSEASDDENPNPGPGKEGDDNNQEEEEDDDEVIIKGLSEMALGKQGVEVDETNLYLAKGPVFR